MRQAVKHLALFHFHLFPEHAGVKRAERCSMNLLKCSPDNRPLLIYAFRQFSSISVYFFFVVGGSENIGLLRTLPQKRIWAGVRKFPSGWSKVV